MVVVIVNVINGGDQVALSYLIRKCQTDGLIKQKKMSMRFLCAAEKRKIKAVEAAKKKSRLRKMMSKYNNNKNN